VLSDRADPQIPRRRRGNRNHHGGDVCGIAVLGLKVLSVLFLVIGHGILAGKYLAI